MACRNSPWLLAIFRLCFNDDTLFLNKFFISSLVIVVYASNIFALVTMISQWLPVFSNFMPLSHKQNVKEHVSSKNSCTWWGFKYHVISRAIAHATLSRKTLTSSGVNEAATLFSAVQSICQITWCMHSSIAFTWGFLTIVGICFIPYDSHRCSKCRLNSLPFSYIT